MSEYDLDRIMWIEIRAGLLGFKKALSYTTRMGAGAGIALAALGRVIRAIDKRWNLGEGMEEENKILPVVRPPNEV